MKVNKIIKKIEKIAPTELAYDWDNSGWQIELDTQNTNKIMLALSVTNDVLNQAINNKCDLIISHHPLIFSKLNKLSIKNEVASIAIKAIQNNIQIYCAHTNLDAAKGGLADLLANKLELNNTFPIEKIDGETGIGRIGELNTEINLDELIIKLKNILNTDNFKIINSKNKQIIKKIALCPGSGADFIKKLKNIDLYITGDVKYHDAIDANDFIVIDAGHYETEKIILPFLKEKLEEFDIEILIAKENTPWQIV